MSNFRLKDRQKIEFLLKDRDFRSVTLQTVKEYRCLLNLFERINYIYLKYLNTQTKFFCIRTQFSECNSHFIYMYLRLTCSYVMLVL